MDIETSNAQIDIECEDSKVYKKGYTFEESAVSVTVSTSNSSATVTKK